MLTLQKPGESASLFSLFLLLSTYISIDMHLTLSTSHGVLRDISVTQKKPLAVFLLIINTGSGQAFLYDSVYFSRFSDFDRDYRN